MFFRNVQDIASIMTTGLKNLFKKRKSLRNQEIFVQNKCIIQKKIETFFGDRADYALSKVDYIDSEI